MAHCVSINTSGLLEYVPVAVTDCLDLVVLSSQEYSDNFISALTALEISELWIWGFISVITPWGIAYGLKWVIKTINQA